MKDATDTRKRKRYTRPQLRTVTIEFGVYGHYGECWDGKGGKDEAGPGPDWLCKT